MAEIRVELLAVEDCPHLEQARRDLESVLGHGAIEVPIQLILVSGPEDAELLGFQGSPTIRIDGDDVVPAPDLAVALSCRLYRDADGRTSGSPPIESIRAAVDAHRRGRLEAFQREEAARIAQFARQADATRSAGLTGAPAPTESSGESEGKPQEG